MKIFLKPYEERRVMGGHLWVFSNEIAAIVGIAEPGSSAELFDAAGGFIGWLARTEDVSEENLKRAVIYGSALASFCVEKFGVGGITDLTYLGIQDRFREFRELSRFDED